MSSEPTSVRWLDEPQKHDYPAAADYLRLLAGRPLSPILLVQGDLTTGTPLQIADGYHGMCAGYHTDENIPIPAKLVSIPVARAAVTGKKHKSGK